MKIMKSASQLLINESWIKLASTALFLCSIPFLLNIISVNASVLPGSGTQSDPFVVADCDDLQSIQTDAQAEGTEDQFYALTNDIDCSATTGWNGGEGFEPIDYFEGTLDGRNFTISELFIDRPTEKYVGVFGESFGIIARLNLTDVDITGDSFVGSIAGYSGGDEHGITVTGSVSGDSDFNYEAVGGLMGRKQNGSITRSTFSGNVTNTGPGTGGLVGMLNVAYLHDLYSDAVVDGTTYVGGLIGVSTGYAPDIDNVYATGSVEGTSYVGGVIGATDASTNTALITDSFGAVSVIGSPTNSGGFAGDFTTSGSNVTLSNLHFDADKFGSTDCYSAINAGQVITCTAQNADGLNSDFFFNNSSNAPLNGWDFTNIWETNVGDYPTLNPTPALSGPGIVSGLSVSQPISPEEVSIQWSAPSNTGSLPIKEYEIEVTYNGQDWTLLFDDNNTQNTVTTFDELRPNTTFKYRVRAITAYSAGDWVESTFTTVKGSTTSISTCAQLMAVDDSDASSRFNDIVLTQNIDCSGIANFEPLGNDDDAWDGPFQGIFNGNGYTISDLNINTDDYAGLFARVEGTVLKNLKLEGGSIVGGSGTGALVGRAEDTDIINVHSNIDVISPGTYDVGGLIGYYENDDRGRTNIIQNVSSTGDVSGEGDVGGLIGELENDEGYKVQLSKVFATGNVSASAGSTGDSFGGLIGLLESVNEEEYSSGIVIIEDSYAWGDVTGYEEVGGLIGYLEVENDEEDGAVAEIVIRRAYASGDVSGDDTVGGLIGLLDEIEYTGEMIRLSNNFAAGAVTTAGSYSGGLVGINDNSSIDPESSNNYFDSSNSLPCADEVALLGCTGIDESTQTNYFKNNNTNSPLDTWDFLSTWIASEGEYPQLNVADSDGDGISDQVENSGPNGGDTNADGISDSIQQRVTSILSNVSNKYVSLEIGGTCSTIASIVIDSESTDESIDDDLYDYPSGFLNFTLTGCTSGGAETITQYYYGDFDIDNAVLKKFDSDTKVFSLIEDAVLTKVVIDGQAALKAVYTVTDGGELDADGIANGSIVDPVGIGVLAVGSPNTGFERTSTDQTILLLSSGIALALLGLYEFKKKN